MSSLLSYAILLGGILTIAVTLYMVAISYFGLPYWESAVWVQSVGALQGRNETVFAGP